MLCRVAQNFGVSSILTNDFIVSDVLVGGACIFIVDDITKSFLYSRFVDGCLVGGACIFIVGDITKSFLYSRFVDGCKDCRMYILVVAGSVILGKVVCQVLCARSPLVSECPRPVGSPQAVKRG